MKFTLADFIAMNIRSFPDRQALEVPRLAGYKCAREVRVWDDLPRNSTGKIQRFIIRGRVTAEPA